MPSFVCLLLGDFIDSASSTFRIPQRNSLLLDMLQLASASALIVDCSMYYGLIPVNLYSCHLQA
jgi:hypothetical protein